MKTSSGELCADERVIVLLKQRRDAASIPKVLGEVGVHALLCATLEEVCAEVAKGIGALIIGDDLISHSSIGCLRDTLARQPAWSELPIMVLLRPGPESSRLQNTLLLPGDVTLIERPVRVNTLVAHVQAALRGRRRQYLVRDQMLELERSERRYRTLFNSIDEAFCIIEVISDKDGKALDYRFLETNPAFVKHTGLSQAQGKAMRQLVPEHEEFWFETYGAIVRTGEPVRFYNRARQLDRWLDVYAFRYGEPQECQVAVLFRDITERREAEEALRRSEKKFATIFHCAPALVAITTLKEGRIADINDTALGFLGYRREEVVGRTTLQIGLWESTQERERMVQAIEDRGRIHDLEVSFRGKTGESYTGLFSGEFIDIDQDRYLLSMVKDITERKRSELEIERLNTDLAAQVEELKEANLELEAFNRMVSHDLRQPLNSIGLSIQTVEIICSDKLDEECQRYLQSIFKKILVMNQLIDTLLRFSGSTRVELRRGPVDVSELARGVAAEVRENETEARRARFDIAEGLTANADKSLLKTVLQNLIGNAWKYTSMRDEAIIEVGARELEGQPAFYVRDNGKGFDMEDAEEIFAPFKRLPGADGFKGFGVGLATVERIIRRHGGRVWAEAQTDRGATFYFTLPVQGGGEVR
ncbi:hypothetical protein GMLC_15980 [Geomonas limicola]|uniref:histidine kinase n=1 Tax=Geomonas limicola TaxID=2740186 RepID=A0A6V8N9T7_9BACT|nr:PAS domain S-box protein [Geomonas limicola]GFO68019.1 hypothetical protein GMLC_15980 [Geomonas limicola]